MNLSNLAILITEFSEAKTIKYLHIQHKATSRHPESPSGQNHHQVSNPSPTVCSDSFPDRVIRLLEPSATNAKVNYTKPSSTNPSTAKSEHSPRRSQTTYINLHEPPNLIVVRRIYSPPREAGYAATVPHLGFGAGGRAGRGRNGDAAWGLDDRPWG